MAKAKKTPSAKKLSVKDKARVVLIGQEKLRGALEQLKSSAPWLSRSQLSEAINAVVMQFKRYLAEQVMLDNPKYIKDAVDIDLRGMDKDDREAALADEAAGLAADMSSDDVDAFLAEYE